MFGDEINMQTGSIYLRMAAFPYHANIFRQRMTSARSSASRDLTFNEVNL